MHSTAVAATAPMLADLAVEIPVLDAGCTFTQVEQLFRDQPGLPAVVTVVEERIFLFDRQYLDSICWTAAAVRC